VQAQVEAFRIVEERKQDIVGVATEDVDRSRAVSAAARLACFPPFPVMRFLGMGEGLGCG